MDWSAELGRFAAHAAVAALVVAVLGGPARPLVRRVAGVVAGARRGRIAVVVVALTLAVRLALMPAIHCRYEYAGDVEEYCEKAVAIARDGNPRAQETKPDGTHFYRTLGWSLPLAGWYRATGVPSSPEGRVRSAQVFGALLAAAAAWAILALGRAIGRETAGRLAALGYALFLPAVVFSLVPYAETWATLTLVIAALLFEKARAAASAAGALGAGAALGLVEGLLLITRFELWWLPFVAAALLVAKRRAIGAAAAAASLVVLLAPIAVNHEMRDGYEGHLRMSVQSGLILYFGNNPTDVTGEGNATGPVQRHVRELYAKDPTGGLARAEAIEWIEAHPFAAIANAPKKLYHLWLAQPQGFTWHIGAGAPDGTSRGLADALRHVAWIEALCVLALGVAGLASGVPSHALWTIALVLHALTWCALAASTRNRYPLEPLLLIAAAAWLETRSARGAAPTPS